MKAWKALLVATLFTILAQSFAAAQDLDTRSFLPQQTPAMSPEPVSGQGSIPIFDLPSAYYDIVSTRHLTPTLFYVAGEDDDEIYRREITSATCEEVGFSEPTLVLAPGHIDWLKAAVDENGQECLAWIDNQDTLWLYEVGVDSSPEQVRQGIQYSFLFEVFAWQNGCDVIWTNNTEVGLKNEVIAPPLKETMYFSVDVTSTAARELMLTWTVRNLETGENNLLLQRRGADGTVDPLVLVEDSSAFTKAVVVDADNNVYVLWVRSAGGSHHMLVTMVPATGGIPLKEVVYSPLDSDWGFQGCGGISLGDRVQFVCSTDLDFGGFGEVFSILVDQNVDVDVSILNDDENPIQVDANLTWVHDTPFATWRRASSAPTLMGSCVPEYPEMFADGFENGVIYPWRSEETSGPVPKYLPMAFKMGL